MVPTKLAAVAMFTFAAGAACSGAGASSAGGGDVCASSAAEAAAQFQPIVAANQSCQKDSDCFIVSLSASCFDQCSATVNEQGRGALERALVLIEARECKHFKQAGCKRTIPPCAPPRPATCQSGRCQL